MCKQLHRTKFQVCEAIVSLFMVLGRKLKLEKLREACLQLHYLVKA